MRKSLHCSVMCFVGASILLSVCAISPSAFAQPKDAAAADALFRQGREAMKKGDYATACPKLAESQRLDPAAGTVLNLAQCEEQVGKFASAMTHYQEAIDRLPPSDPRVKLAKDGLAAVGKRAPRLVVKLPADAPQGTTILRDGVELGGASVGTSLPVDPGEHVITTKAPGRREHKETVSLLEGENKEVTAVLGELAPDEVDQAPKGRASSRSRETPSTIPNNAPASAQRTIGYVLTGVGVVGLGLGGYLVLRGKSLDSDATASEHFHPDSTLPGGTYCDSVCHDKTEDSRSSYKIAYGALAGGGVLVVGGLALVLFAPSTKEMIDRSGAVLNVAAGKGVFSVQTGGVW